MRAVADQFTVPPELVPLAAVLLLGVGMAIFSMARSLFTDPTVSQTSAVDDAQELTIVLAPLDAQQEGQQPLDQRSLLR